jgi:hypothetical protein
VLPVLPSLLLPAALPAAACWPAAVNELTGGQPPASCCCAAANGELGRGKVRCGSAGTAGSAATAASASSGPPAAAAKGLNADMPAWWGDTGVTALDDEPAAAAVPGDAGSDGSASLSRR